jgi:hypothetical protein
MATINNMNDSNLQQKIEDPAFFLDIYKKTEKIADMFNLHIDQLGEMDAEIKGIFLGVNKSSDFVKDISERLEIDKGKAGKIAEEVNKEIFQAIKANLQTQTDSSSDISALEQMGNFTLEREKEENGNGANGNGAVTAGDRDALIEGIENPSPAQPPISGGVVHTEPMIDHLLGNTVGSVEQKVEHKVADAPANLPVGEGATAPAPVQTRPRSGVDPYKEAV